MKTLPPVHPLQISAIRALCDLSDNLTGQRMYSVNRLIHTLSAMDLGKPAPHFTAHQASRRGCAEQIADNSTTGTNLP